VADWFGAHPAAVAVTTALLMWCDWALSIVQQRVRSRQAVHYLTYPVDTIEGSHFLRDALRTGHFVHPRHAVATVILSGAVAGTLWWLPPAFHAPFLGFVWGVFFLVLTTHLGNLASYAAIRRGVHGQVWMHQRTAYLTQMGRYLALTLLVAILALGSGSAFVAGVALSGLFSSARQLAWMRRVPTVPEPDVPPTQVRMA
jgi:hypothetical protein